MADLVTRLDMDSGGFDRGVSSAIGSIQKLDKEARLAQRGFQDFFKGANTDEMRQQFAGVDQILNKLERSLGSSSTSMKKQIKSMTAAAQELEQTWRDLSDAEKETAAGQELRSHIDQLIAAGGELKDTAGDIKSAMNFAASDTAQLDAAAQAVTTLSAGFQLGAGVATLFGVSEEKVAQVQQSLVSIMSVVNALQTIQNALQKESAVMQFISIARTQGLAVALGLKTAAQTADTAATEAGTAAQTAFNLAVLANPYVIAAAALAGLVAGIVYFVSTANDADVATRQWNDTLDKAAENMSNNAQSTAEQIQAALELKRRVDEANGSQDKLNKTVFKAIDLQKKAGIEVKNTAQAYKLQTTNTENIVNAIIARAQATAVETAASDQLVEVLKKLADIRKRLEKGETIDAGDFEDIGIDPEEYIKKHAGFSKENGVDDWFASIFQPSARDVKLVGKNIDKVMQNLTGVAVENWEKNSNKQAKDLGINLRNSVDTSGINWIDEKDSESVSSASKSYKQSASSAKQLSNETKETLSTLEGCDAIISEANKKITQLDKKQADYNKELIKWRATIFQASKAKLDLIDKSDFAGMQNYRKQLQLVIEQGKVLNIDVKEFKDKLKDTEEEYSKLAETKFDLFDKNTQEGANQMKSIATTMVNTLTKGSEEWKKWVDILRDATTQANKLKQETDNILNGVKEGSKTWIQQQISEIDKQINNESDPIKIRALELEKKNLQKQLYGLNDLVNDTKIEGPKKNDSTFDFLLTPLEKEEKEYNALSERVEYLRGLMKENHGDSFLAAVQKELDDLLPKLTQAEKNINNIKLNDKAKEMKKEIASLSQTLANDFINGLDNTKKSIEGFKDIDNVWDGFMQGFNLFNSLINTVTSLIDTFNKLVSTIDTLSSVTQTMSATTQAASAANTAAATTETTAQIGNALASGTASGAKLPFPANIAAIAAVVSIIMSVIAMIASLKFANGGIVPGTSFTGDNLTARVNSGEMILNKRQQTNLFNALNNNSIGSGNGQLTVRIHGSDLVGVMKNYNNKMNKIK